MTGPRATQPARPAPARALRGALLPVEGLEALRSAVRLALTLPSFTPAVLAGAPGLSGRMVASAVTGPVPTQVRRAAHTPVPAQPPAQDSETTEDGVPVEHLAVAAIVTRAQAGDPEAFGELYDRYVDLVYRYVYYRVNSATLAEDLVSETFLRALRRISSFTWQGKDFAAWLVTIARNLIADHYKSSRYRLEVSTADLLGSTGDRPDAGAGPESEVLASLTNATLLEAVKKLGAEQQECVVLRFLQGMSVAETALAMGKNEGAIKALQYRAVRALARVLPEGFSI